MKQILCFGDSNTYGLIRELLIRDTDGVPAGPASWMTK